MDTAEVIRGDDVRADLHPVALRCDGKDICSLATKEYLIKCANMTHTHSMKTCVGLCGKAFFGCLAPAELQRSLFSVLKGKLMPGCGFIHPHLLELTSLCCSKHENN